MTRCEQPVGDRSCPRPLGHAGRCRTTWFDTPICGAWMRRSSEPCSRRLGHAHEHRTADYLDNRRRARAAA